MKLIELLSLISENAHVVVTDRDCKQLSYYDGRNSIDEKYNDVNVIKIDLLGNALNIMIDLLEGDENV